VRFQIHDADNSNGGIFGGFLLWECKYEPMRKSTTSDLILDFIVLCNERKAVKKLREYEAFVDHDFDEWVIAAICEYQLLLPLKEFMATGFEGRVV
jgi:hypothetical protein